MQFVTDLHLHSYFSRAVSKNMTLPVMAAYARQKGLDILSASDWTHPGWYQTLREQLEETDEGIYTLISKKAEANEGKPIYFILSTEISCIYSWKGKVRRVHVLVFVPHLTIAQKVTQALEKQGCNLRADGRPIIGLSAKALLELLLTIDSRCVLIPAHIWTPHFGVYGSASGFDSLEECFEELTPYIYGIETGLSSDPEMNWRVAELEHRSILSFSDAHSPIKMGREATVMELASPTYEQIRSAIMRPSMHTSYPSITKKENENRVEYTIEFYPEEGKYHYSGHRACHVCMSPEEITRNGKSCPVCHRKLTEGVLSRVQQLASRDTAAVLGEEQAGDVKRFFDKTNHHPPYVKLVPLLEVVAESMAMTVASKKVQQSYLELCKTLGSELFILLHASFPSIQAVAGERVAAGIENVRKGELVITPGYDGIFGKVTLPHNNASTNTSQLSLDISLENPHK